MCPSDEKKNDPRKMKTQDFYEKLMRVEGVTGARHFQASPEAEIQVNIRPDKSISLGKFLPDPVAPGHYKAHPQTIRAMRKDIFVGGAEVFEDLEVSYQCWSCHSELDLQFWIHCPFCEAEIKLST